MTFTHACPRHTRGWIMLVTCASVLIPGVAVAFTQPLQNKISESLEGTPAPLQVKLFGPDIQVLAQTATHQFLSRSTSRPGQAQNEPVGKCSMAPG